MKGYYRVILGKENSLAEEAFKNNFIAVGFMEDLDLSNKLTDDKHIFNKTMIPIYQSKFPDKNKITAGLSCSFLWTVSKGIKIGDIVLCPTTKRTYYVGEIISEYKYVKDHKLPHQREVRWYKKELKKDEMSESLKKSLSSIGTVSEIDTKYSYEIEQLLSGSSIQTLKSLDSTVEDPSVFAIEEHLEDFLVKNWDSTIFGKKYNIYTDENGGKIGQQFPTTDSGTIDILAISKDNKEILVIELKKGRTSDNVVGQVQRYMGYVKEELAEPNQKVQGVIIAFDNDIKIKRALSVTQNIDFYTYKINFKLDKVK